MKLLCSVDTVIKPLLMPGDVQVGTEEELASETPVVSVPLCAGCGLDFGRVVLGKLGRISARKLGFHRAARLMGRGRREKPQPPGKQALAREGSPGDRPACCAGEMAVAVAVDGFQDSWSGW